MKNTIRTLIACAIIFAGCEEEISLNLPQPTHRMVVEGRIEKYKDGRDHVQSITLSTVDEFLGNTRTPRINDALVSVTDGNGVEHTYQLDTDVDGRYINNTIEPEVGEIFTLNISWNDQHFRATEIMEPVVSLDNAYQKYQEETTFDDGGEKVAIDFTDPADQRNFYFWEVYLDGINTTVPTPGNSNNVIGDDDQINGQSVVGYFPNEEKVFEAGDRVTVKHIGVNENMYRYLFLIFEQTGTGRNGGLFDTPPAIVRGNVENLTSGDDFALGYFGACEIDEREVIIIE